MTKKLSIAFIWHMHQPVYKSDQNGIYLMPWVRLRAVKDYLDMLLVMDKFPGLKLNFNLVPLLISSIYDYGYNNAHDIYSRLTITPVEELSDDEKEFILNHFFDANYQNMVLPNAEYKKLYDKRFQSTELGINDFSPQEYSDIMAWFNLIWFDPMYKENDELKALFSKKNGEFTLADRIRIIELQRDIIKKIIPAYKQYQNEGKIEISTSPYFHPILPVLLDMKDVIEANPNTEYPELKSDMTEDAAYNVKRALDKFEEIFGKRPAGMWPSEQCISEKTLQLFMDAGVKWTISDEGVLEQTLKKEFVRDFRGYLEDPYDLCHSYTYKHDGKQIGLLFRDAVLPNLIGFEYPHHDPVKAANDLYDRIKTTQRKLLNSPDKMHLLTIAMDGENCWENYRDDGHEFLDTLYRLIQEDENLETVCVSDYIDAVANLEPAGSTFELDHLKAGSWINRDFLLWIGEPTKNLAWTYMDKARCDLKEYEKAHPDDPKLKLAYEEFYICQSSDWYWWYGEPNDSGQDDIFDHLFREHLKNIYKIIKKPVPAYLDAPLTEFIEARSRYPKAAFDNFELTGRDDKDHADKWELGGCIDIPAPPTMQEKRFFNKICFGYDKDNLYLRFDINRYILDKDNGFKDFNQIYIYFKNRTDNAMYSAPIRTVNKTEAIIPVLKEPYNSEVKLTLFKKFKFSAQLAHATHDNLWVIQLQHNIEFVFKDYMEIKIPFADIRVAPDELVEFFIVQGPLGIVDDFYPQNSLLPVIRPQNAAAVR